MQPDVNSGFSPIKAVLAAVAAVRVYLHQMSHEIPSVVPFHIAVGAHEVALGPVPTTPVTLVRVQVLQEAVLGVAGVGAVDAQALEGLD